MNNKSYIRLILEDLEYKNILKEHINNIEESYTIEDAIFTIDTTNQFHPVPYEVDNGYFEVTSTFESLDDAIKVFENNKDQGIRVMNNKYQLGTIYESLYDCPMSDNDIILNIKTLSEID